MRATSGALSRIVLLAAVGGCSTSPDITTESEYGAASIKGIPPTFDWPATPTRPATARSRFANPQLDDFIRSVVEETLSKKGYTRMPGDRGFWIEYGATSESNIQVTDSLSLYVTDPASKELMWRGRASAILDPAMPPDESRSVIRDAVNRLLAEFPGPGQVVAE